jgi:hypothetical protein
VISTYPYKTSIEAGGYVDFLSMIKQVSKARAVLMLFLVMIFLAIIALLASFLTSFMWNTVAVVLFGAAKITYEAALITVIAGQISGSVLFFLGAREDTLALKILHGYLASALLYVAWNYIYAPNFNVAEISFNKSLLMQIAFLVTLHVVLKIFKSLARQG